MRSRRLMALAVASSLVAFALLAGCGSTKVTAPTVPKKTSTTPSGTSQSVKIIDFAFEPASLTVGVGTTVKWTNAGAAVHTVTSDTGAFESGQLQTGGQYEFTFNAPGTFAYHCSNHPQMTATVTVTGGTSGGTSAPGGGTTSAP
jgi:plastocyanin